MRNDETLFWSILALSIVFMLFNGCATMPGYPTPEEMPQGRVVCASMCSQYGREYLEYRYDGKCVCK